MNEFSSKYRIVSKLHLINKKCLQSNGNYFGTCLPLVVLITVFFSSFLLFVSVLWMQSNEINRMQDRAMFSVDFIHFIYLSLSLFLYIILKCDLKILLPILFDIISVWILSIDEKKKSEFLNLNAVYASEACRIF